jgi:hypothetical protein
VRHDADQLHQIRAPELTLFDGRPGSERFAAQLGDRTNGSDAEGLRGGRLCLANGERRKGDKSRRGEQDRKALESLR